MKIKIKIYGDKVYINSCGLNMPEDDTEYESFDVNAYGIIDKKMIDYLGDNPFETDKG